MAKIGPLKRSFKPNIAKKDDALDDPDLPPPPEEVAAEIVENLETALERFRRVTNVEAILKASPRIKNRSISPLNSHTLSLYL